jgi:hypothetical protein
MNPLLQATAAALGPRPREAFDLRLGPTFGLTDDDPIVRAHADAKLLSARGELTFGAVVLAHGDLETTPSTAIPAVVVHAPPRGTQVPLADLLEVGTALWEVRSNRDPSLEEFARWLGDFGRPGRVPVPPRLTFGAQLEITRIAITKQLPGRRLLANFVPLLVHRRSRAAAMLPVTHWAPNLVTAFARWRDGE